jgi:hypothetical protein
MGQAVKCKTILVRGNVNGVKPDFVVKDLLEVAEIICQEKTNKPMDRIARLTMEA